MQPKKKRTLRLKWRILLLPVLSFSLLSCDDPESKRQLATLRQIAADTPTFADFHEGSTYNNNKPNNALFSVCYESSVKYDEVKAYYSRALIEKGWSPPEEKPVYGSFGFKQEKDSRELIFRRGEYRISIGYDPKDHSGCNYAISYIWEK